MDTVALTGAGILVATTCLVVGWAMGQALCRRTVRQQLWALFFELDKEPVSPAKYKVLDFIKRMEV